MKATHYSVGDRGTACGIVGSVFVTTAASAVDCVRCRRTSAVRFARSGSGYSLAQVAWELQETAAGRAYYGNALRVAKDVSGVTAKDRTVLDAWATGATANNPARNWSVELQDIAKKLLERFRAPAPQTDRGEG